MQNGAVDLEQEGLNWIGIQQAKQRRHLRKAFDRCSMIVQRTCSTMSATGGSSKPAGSTLQGPVDACRHNVSRPRKVLHLVDMERS